jgi:hypothetical protein
MTIIVAIVYCFRPPYNSSHFTSSTITDGISHSAVHKNGHLQLARSRYFSIVHFFAFSSLLSLQIISKKTARLGKTDDRERQKKREGNGMECNGNRKPSPGMFPQKKNIHTQKGRKSAKLVSCIIVRPLRRKNNEKKAR